MSNKEKCPIKCFNMKCEGRDFKKCDWYKTENNPTPRPRRFPRKNKVLTVKTETEMENLITKLKKRKYKDTYTLKTTKPYRQAEPK